MHEPIHGVRMTTSTDTSEDGKYYGHVRSELFAFVPAETKRLLDVGCAEGTFGAGIMKARPGIEVWGVEPVQKAATVAEGRLRRVICGPAEAAIEQLPDGYFDCVTFNDVLEHMVDPWSMLRSIQSKLAPDGVIVASIPNLRHFPVLKSLMFDGDFRYVEEGILDRTHLRFFTKKSMQRLFGDCGLSVTRMEGLNWQALPGFMAIINRLSGRALDDMYYLQFGIQARPLQPA